MDSDRKSALLVGVFFLLTFVTSIAALVFYKPLLGRPEFVLGGPGATWSIAVGAWLEIALVITNIGTAVVLFPILKRQNEALALGYVASRIMESALIAVGIVSLLAVTMLRQQVGSDPAADAPALIATARSLLAVHDATFLLGPAFGAPFGNGLLLGWLMYRSGLVPRTLAVIGLVGGVAGLATATAVLFGAYPQLSLPSIIATGPEIIWELSLGILLTVRGFRRPLGGDPGTARVPMDAGGSAPAGAPSGRPRAGRLATGSGGR